MRRWTVIWLVCCCCLTTWAQDFKVESFSLLESDLTARVDPVFDLNGDACALIKVAADKAFVFSGPLGIVKREDRTTEILLYVPAGTKQLTISHPRLGMMRNYALPLVLRGRNTYEMILKPIVRGQEEVPALMPDTLIEAPAVNSVAISAPTPDIKVSPKKLYPSYWTIMAQAGIGKAYTVGTMVAYLHKVGFYASILGNWAGVKSDGLECDEDGKLYSTNTTPYYNTTSKQTSYILDAGATLLLARGVYLFGGAGYGTRQKYWETIEGTVVKNRDLSAEGVVVSTGALFCYKHLSGQIGVKTISLKDYMLTLGIGLSL